MHQNNQHSFENFIIQCCKSKEWDLRRFLKRQLKKAGFAIQEDSYRSDRVDAEKKYGTVHNLLAIRGNPRICLVAHTDVCRDHSFSRKGGTPDINPVIKDWAGRQVIQDKDCQYQVGGDDRLGVAINTWLALNTGYDLAVLFTTDEEVGLISAGECRFPELAKFDLLVQVDRGNKSNQVVSRIGGTQLCSRKTIGRLLKIAEEMGQPRDEVSGLATDVLMMIRNGVGKEAVNMTCGYHNSFGDSAKEYIEIAEAKSTLSFVSHIIQYYDLRLDLGEAAEEEKKEEIVGEFDIEQYIQSISTSIREKKSGKKFRKKRKYIEAIFDIDAYNQEHGFVL